MCGRIVHAQPTRQPLTDPVVIEGTHRARARNGFSIQRQGLATRRPTRPKARFVGRSGVGLVRTTGKRVCSLDIA